MVKVFRVEHPKTGAGLYCHGAAEAYDEAIGAERIDKHNADIDSLWNMDRCPAPSHKNENSAMNAPPGDDITWLFAFTSKKAMLAWTPSFKGRCRLDELGLALTTYEVNQGALIKGRFQCAFDVDRARPTRTTPLVTRRERREQNGSN